MKLVNSKISKPKLKYKSAFNYKDVINYIFNKYKLKTFDNKFDNKQLYLNFTYWLINNLGWYSNYNIIYILPIKKLIIDTNTPDWIKYILKSIYKEYNINNMKFWK